VQLTKRIDVYSLAHTAVFEERKGSWLRSHTHSLHYQYDGSQQQKLQRKTQETFSEKFTTPWEAAFDPY